MNPGEEFVADEMERRFYLGWQGWHLDKERLVLWHERLAKSNGYEIDLLRCNTSAEVLGWIMEIGPAFGLPIIGLVRAFDDILQPRINLCLDGESRSRRLTQRKIRQLVAQAREPEANEPPIAPRRS
jgi:hypothetical protein